MLGKDKKYFKKTKLAARQFSNVTRLGDFLKFLETKFLPKETQTIGNFLGYFEKPHSNELLGSLYP